MRGTRWLLLVAIAAILYGIGFTYRAQKKVLEREAPAKPAPLPPELTSSSDRWHWVQRETRNGIHVTADITADDFKQLKDTPRVDLKVVTMKLPSKQGDTYDLVKSSAASYFINENRLYSDGDVEITLNLPIQGEPKHAPVSIKTSGASFDSTTQRAETDRASSFTFERGDGTATGASYDPASHALLLKSDVKVDWKPLGPRAKLMKIEAASLEYHEAEAEILLKPWGRLTRENTVVEGENVIVHLQEDGEGHRAIRKVDAVKAHGTDTYPNRKLQYSADELTVDFDDSGQVQKITAQTNARLVSTSATTETTVTARRVDLNFADAGEDSVLSTVNADGDSVVTAKPLPTPGHPASETHILRADKLDMKMRDGGREIETVAARTPGTLEFVPNAPAQHHRLLTGKDMFIAYGAQNRIDSFRANDVRTQTDPTADEAKRKVPVSITTSRTLAAKFDPATNKMATMEQAGDFAYEQGDRKARASKATLDEAQNVILLDTAARMWDGSGATSADRIRLDQRTGNFTAEGNVSSSRMPDKDQKKNSEMLSGDQPLQAQAAKMDSSNRNRRIHYEGGVTMWQGANRIQAASIDVDREKRMLVADRNVVTNLWEQPKEDAKAPSATAGKKAPPAPVLTVVHAPHLVYTDQDRLAYYSGGVALDRPGLKLKSAELRAYLAESGADSQLDKAVADGKVQIDQNSPSGQRTGTGEHAEYYTGEQKIYLRGGEPKLVERKPNGKLETTEGSDLTYFANDDRLLVNGIPGRRGQSHIQRK